MHQGVTYRANKIYENLYQGGAPPPGIGLKNSGIQVLVLCAKENQDPKGYEGLEVICAPGDDDHRKHRLMLFIDGWRDAAAQVAAHVKAGRKVLVTCMQGLNRSGMVTALALRELTGWSGKRIVEHIQQHRTMALCNPTFADFIIESFPEEQAPVQESK